MDEPSPASPPNVASRSRAHAAKVGGMDEASWMRGVRTVFRTTPNALCSLDVGEGIEPSKLKLGLRHFCDRSAVAVSNVLRTCLGKRGRHTPGRLLLVSHTERAKRNDADEAIARHFGFALGAELKSSDEIYRQIGRAAIAARHDRHRPEKRADECKVCASCSPMQQ
ncbi:hypothetical protein CFAM422_008067 [Trichoderma lentiforme]|uniref:Uncharacterized protein n=1 Tax=Trichoderma lentiforme TaxID=1567552 RepID=A0A9P5CCL1_9HYPO|nr:hypothetical protein CFAM422_008067 [Trichoderma lentiforme]